MLGKTKAISFIYQERKCALKFLVQLLKPERHFSMVAQPRDRQQKIVKYWYPAVTMLGIYTEFKNCYWREIKY